MLWHNGTFFVSKKLRKDDDMKDIITISTVTFNAKWGEKQTNLNRILGYIECAAKQGSHMIVFPEMALTGYDDQAELPKAQKMQTLQAELIPGPSTDQVAMLAKQYGLYVVMGMPERDPDNESIIYNALAVFKPDGSVQSYRKMQLPYPEPNWATRGDKPFILHTEWGAIGIAICYDTYAFPEMMRYYAAMGCRMHINSTALAYCHGKEFGPTTIEAQVIQNRVYVVSSNLGGTDLYNEFWGGSSVLGPSRNLSEVFYYAGYRFDDPIAKESQMFTTTIDLTLADRSIFQYNPAVDSPDFRPDQYIKMYQEILENPEFGAHK